MHAQEDKETSKINSCMNIKDNIEPHGMRHISEVLEYIYENLKEKKYKCNGKKNKLLQP